ncbi:MAG: amidohydrolase family protein [Chloroflexi bacterium]|jgi:L-fuconolactonase|nr:amidohydrolase family protein [Chloroflexota bacterium]MDA1281253.1 amidohydrolase family protein [Chloroflexota bacterium]
MPRHQMIVDTHVHIWEMPPIAPIGPSAPNFTSKPKAHGNAELQLADMDANGVDKTVLVQTSFSTWDNEYVAASAIKYPDRFVSMGLVDPMDERNAAQAVYWMDERQMQGFRFHPQYYSEVDILKRPENEAMFKEIEKHEGIVQIHNRPEHAHQLDYVAAKYPGITFLIDHMMYPEPNMAPDWDVYKPVLALAKHENVLMKISDIHNRSESDQHPFSDMHDVIKMAISAFGVDRVMWGTGYPGYHRVEHGWLSLADELKLVREGFDWLSSREQDKYLGGNAIRIWNWNRE